MSGDARLAMRVALAAVCAAALVAAAVYVAARCRVDESEVRL